MGTVNNFKDIYEDHGRTCETLTETGNSVSHNKAEPSHDHQCNTISNPASSEQEYTYARQDTNFPRSGAGTNNAVYHTLEQPQRPADDGIYNYLDNTAIANPPSSELEYTYAKDTDVPRFIVDKATKDSANNVLYHTLEQLADDGAYSYLDNTRITKPLTSELEYTYAKDTDLPRVIVDKAAQNSANKPVYPTIEQPEQPADDGTYSYPDNTSITKPPPSELEYTYAKDTDLPRINNINQNTPAKSPANNALYHTLEQPADNELYLTPEELNPPQAPVYSTLEEPQVNNSEEQVRIYYTVNYSPSPQNLE